MITVHIFPINDFNPVVFTWGGFEAPPPPRQLAVPGDVLNGHNSGGMWGVLPAHDEQRTVPQQQSIICPQTSIMLRRLRNPVLTEECN